MRAKKRLGQNFLKCSWVSQKMLKAAELKEGERVLEIGPGKGALTGELLRAGANVFAVEKDKELLPFLKDKFKDEIHKGQLILKSADIKDIIKDKGFFESLADYKLIANIPYYITGELLRMFLSGQVKPRLIMFLVQKEVAQRVVSKKESILSLSVKFYGEPELVANVSSKCFNPEPKVDSAILKIQLKDKLPYREHEELFFKVLHAAFSSKRKKLLNNLQYICPKDKLANFLKGQKIKDTARAEELSLEDFLKLVSFIKSECLDYGLSA